MLTAVYTSTLPALAAWNAERGASTPAIAVTDLPTHGHVQHDGSERGTGDAHTR